MHNAAVLFAGVDDVRLSVDKAGVEANMLRGALDAHAQQVAFVRLAWIDPTQAGLGVKLGLELPVIWSTRVSTGVLVWKP